MAENTDYRQGDMGAWRYAPVELEIHETRGVLYVHDLATGRTLLRVCRIPPGLIGHATRDPLGMLDLTCQT